MNSTLTDFERYVVVPDFGDIVGRYKMLMECDRLFATGRRLNDLAELKEVSSIVFNEWKAKSDLTVVEDIAFTLRTSTIEVGKKRITLPYIEAELFKVLLRNAGRVVPRSELFHPYKGHEFQTTHLGAHICVLRKMLGARIGNRIETVKGQGYRYVVRR